MTIVQTGKMVSISYVVRDGSDQIVEYSDLPVTYLHGGQHELFPQIERALEGKEIGDEVTVKLASKDAFGPHDSQLTFTDDIENSPPELRFVGAELDAESGSREVLHFRVTEINDGKITIDANHVLAGQDVTFVVTVTEVRNPDEQELKGQ